MFAIQGCPFRGVPLYIKVMYEDVTCATHLAGNAFAVFEELMILKIKIIKCWICDILEIHIPQKFMHIWYTVKAEILANILFGGLLKTHCWRDLKLADFSTLWRETHACSIHGSIMV